MKLADFDYNLPKNLIAQKPKIIRSRSRLLVYGKQNNKIEHKKFFNLANYLHQGDVLVFNNSKVMPARLIGKKHSGGKMEVLLLKQENDNNWQAMVGKKSKTKGLVIEFAKDFNCILTEQLTNKTWLIKFNKQGRSLWQNIDKYGKTPIPPYIKNTYKEPKLRKKYQTVYADKFGSAAAPTAGLHFTKRLKKKLNKIGVQFEYVTLHVGLDTFAPVTQEDITKHQIHKELVSVDKNTLLRLSEAKKQGRRIIAVGTTSARTLEALAWEILTRHPKNIEKQVGIFIYPGYQFKIINGLITNFHLPKSTLIMLVSAFIGQEKTFKLYNLAIEKKYRFYSFGDAMFLY